MTPTSKEHLRIAIVCDPVSDAVAGVVVSTIRFAQRLKERGHHVIFIAAKSPASPSNDFFLGMRAYRSRSFLLPWTNGEWHVSFPRKSEIKRILEDEEIDIVHSMLPMPSSVASLAAARMVGIPSIVHSHAQPENIFLHLPTYFPRKGLGEIFYRILYWLYKKADGIVYPTEFARALFARAPFQKPNVVISNGVDLDRFTIVDASSFRKKHGIPLDAPHLFFAGRIQPEKSLDTLLRALPIIHQTFPKVRVSIAGSGDLEENLRTLSRTLGIESSVSFLGRVSDEDLILAYNSADIFVMPSLAELEGMVVLEAMACGKPLLIANAPESASRYFVTDNGALFCPKNPHDLALKAVVMLSDKLQLALQGARSLENAKQFNLTESASQLEAFYRVFI